jgi:hypothetical protein
MRFVVACRACAGGSDAVGGPSVRSGNENGNGDNGGIGGGAGTYGLVNFSVTF